MREGSAVLRCQQVIGFWDACAEGCQFLLRLLNLFFGAFNFTVPLHERLIGALGFLIVFEVFALDTRLIGDCLRGALAPRVPVSEVIEDFHSLFIVLRFFVAFRQHQLRVVAQFQLGELVDNDVKLGLRQRKLLCAVVVHAELVVRFGGFITFRCVRNNGLVCLDTGIGLIHPLN